MTSDAEELAADCERFADLHSNPSLRDTWLRRAALIRRLEKERDEAQTSLDATRNKALDEAAAVARRYGATPAPGRDGGTMILQSVNGHDVANAILALKSPAKEPTT